MMNLHQTFRHLKTISVQNSFYCVETVCAPCGVVIAWTKFDKSESPTQILKFLESIYQTEESRPDYICIDKACVVLHTAITVSQMEVGKEYGKKPVGLLLTVIIILIIVLMITFVASGVILLH